MQLKCTLVTIVAWLLVSILPALTYAQNIETFESVTASGGVKPTVFVNTGQSFTITTGNCFTGGTFGVFIPSNSYAPCNGGSNVSNSGVSTYGVGTSCANGTCTGTSAKFIDNGTSTGLGQTYSIKTTNAALFTIKSLFLFLSANQAATPSAAGGVTFQGKIGNTVVFTYNKTTGFDSTYSVNSGFTYINFASVNYANININELQIQAGSSANYVAIDNFVWGTSVPLPVTLLSFTAETKGKAVLLNWSAAKERNFNYYELESSTDGKTFRKVATIQADENRSSYNYIDAFPANGYNYYRLKMAGKDGSQEYSSIVAVQINDAESTVKIYPNPVTDKLIIQISDPTSVTLQIIDMTGRMLRAVSVMSRGEIDLSNLPAGIYQYRVMSKEGSLIQQGKITKE
jgi:hypothetical protein